MYAPAPPRPKKTDIVRARTGCYTCRARHRKCDETKPECNRCKRTGSKCEGYAVRYSFRDTTASVSSKVASLEAKRLKLSPGGESSKPGSKKSNTRRSNHKDTTPPEIEPSTPSTIPSDLAATSTRSQSSKDSASTSVSSPFPSIPSPAYTLDFRDDPLICSHGNNLSISSPTFIQGFEDNFQDLLESIFLPLPPNLKANPERQLSPLLEGTGEEGNPFHRSLQRLNNAPTDIDLSDAAQRREQLYLAHFENYVANILSPAILESTRSIINKPGLRNAVLALSASNLAHIKDTKRDFTSGAILRYFEASQDSHLAYAFEYYNSVICMLADSRKSGSMSAESRLAITLLCALFEWESGSPRAFLAHISGADALVESEHKEIARTSSGKRLLSGWAQIHARRNLHRLPFRPLEVEKDTSACAPIAASFVDSDGQAFSLLSSAYCMRQRIILEKCMALDHEEPLATINRTVEWYTDLFAFPFISDEEIRKRERVLRADDLINMLAKLRNKLDSWHDDLDPHDLPMQKFTSQNIAFTTLKEGSFEITPLYFHSYKVAMKYLHYVMAQIICDEDHLRSYISRSELDTDILATPDKSVSPWVITALRIIAGLDLKKCDSEDTYCLGLLWITFNLSLCCPDCRVLQYIFDSVIPRLEVEVTHGPVLFSLGFFKRYLRLQYTEILNGRLPMLLHIHQRVDEESISRKESTRQLWAIIHGRYKNGGVFNDFVRIE